VIREREMSNSFFVGVDPQQNNVSVCVLNDVGEPVYWQQVVMQLRKTFPSASDWQEMVIRVVASLLRDVSFLGDDTKVYVEQQRGRLNSIVEQTVLCTFKRLYDECKTVHPRKWRKSHGFFKRGVSNADNKKASKANVRDVLKAYGNKCGGNVMEANSERIHDLCDAYLIARSLWLKSNEERMTRNNGKQ
jgi:hypothetical protein